MPTKKVRLGPLEILSTMRIDNSCLGSAELEWVLSIANPLKGNLPKMPIPYRKMGLKRKILLEWVIANETYYKVLRDELRRLYRLKEYAQNRIEFDKRIREEHPLRSALDLVTMESECYERRLYYVQVRSGRYEEEGTFTQEDIDALYKKQKGKCRYFRYCGRSFADYPYTIDHRIAVTLGGSSDPSNLQLLCKSCNSIKGNSYIASFERRLKERYAKPRCD